MKYQLTLDRAVFNEEGVAIKAGYATIYHIDEFTKEYVNATIRHFPMGSELPDLTYLDQPHRVSETEAIVREGEQWIYPLDYRGRAIYAKESRQETVMSEIGDIPADYTLQAPKSEFDYWDGERWVLDSDKQHRYNIKRATAKKAALLAEATTHLACLQDAIDTGTVTEQEWMDLNEWKIYRVALSHVDTTIDDVIFPPQPTN